MGSEISRSVHEDVFITVEDIQNVNQFFEKLRQSDDLLYEIVARNRHLQHCPEKHEKKIYINPGIDDAASPVTSPTTSLPVLENTNDYNQLDSSWMNCSLLQAVNSSFTPCRTQPDKIENFGSPVDLGSFRNEVIRFELEDMSRWIEIALTGRNSFHKTIITLLSRFRKMAWIRIYRNDIYVARISFKQFSIIKSAIDSFPSIFDKKDNGECKETRPKHCLFAESEYMDPYRDVRDEWVVIESDLQCRSIPIVQVDTTDTPFSFEALFKKSPVSSNETNSEIESEKTEVVNIIRNDDDDRKAYFDESGHNEDKVSEAKSSQIENSREISENSTLDMLTNSFNNFSIDSNTLSETPTPCVINEENKGLIDDSTCIICLERPSNETLSCAHQFCSECIKLWFSNSSTCPACRQACDYSKNVWIHTELPTILDLSEYLAKLLNDYSEQSRQQT